MLAILECCEIGLTKSLREEGKKKWDAQRSLKFVNKLKRKKAVGTLQALVPQDENVQNVTIDLPKGDDLN